ncbi:Large terminase phage packaging protein [Xaviernesmea oryzae]|uniref:Large terminase phage packaging protein n=1 Tax=Xaviernesmea oryzae TaxID=464029 RepID=A0A1X7F9Z8_9HYPH|nr:Large terminase phage packaging protein [Xaviernesmea oryzae]
MDGDRAVKPIIDEEGGVTPPSALPGISPSRGEIDLPRGPASICNRPPEQEGQIVDLAGFTLDHERDWDFKGRPEQKPPAGNWRTWLIMGGRGSGKTRAGAEWVHALASAGERSALRIALVAETLGDAREVMVDGVSGICRIARSKRPDFEISRRRLVWSNGAVAQIFSSEDPEALRGPQFHFAWCDELAKWKHAEETFDMLQFGLRLGADPRQLVTTTPRPVPVLKRLIADPGTRLARISTEANAANLAPGFLQALEARYGGTRLGRQEIAGELIEDREDALWKRADLEACRIGFHGGYPGGRFTGALRRIVVAVDPPSGSGEGSCCGIVVAGLETGGRAVVLADCSVEGASPAGWAHAVTKAYARFQADRVVAEVNQGGEMVTAMLRSVDASLPVTMVRATRGKFLRAEPVAALYEQGRVAHAGRFADLEDQMCDFGPDGLSSGRSPDRLDALVWALTALLLEGSGEPRVRGI